MASASPSRPLSQRLSQHPLAEAATYPTLDDPFIDPDAEEGEEGEEADAAVAPTEPDRVPQRPDMDTSNSIAVSEMQQQDQQPPSPLLEPVEPRMYSTVSSLGSRGLRSAEPSPMVRPSLAASAIAPHPLSAASPVQLPQTDDSLSHVEAAGADVQPVDEKEQQQKRQQDDIGDIDDSNNDDKTAGHAETHALMQMLSVVGSRFLEAEQAGMLPGDLEEAGDDEAPVSTTSAVEEDGEGEGDEEAEAEADEGQADDEEARPLPSIRGFRSVLAAKVGAYVFDDEREDTPRASNTPLEGSLVARRQARATARQQPRTAASALASSSSSPSPSPSSSASLDASATGLGVSIHALSMAFGDGGGGRTADDEHDEADGEEDEEDEEGDQREPGGALHAQREQLSRKLQDIFGLDASEDVVSCHACWLFRRVLLQGHMYVTRSFVCFYAYLPSREDRVLKAGPLRKRTKRTHRFSRHWAVVRGRSLSWYESERDPYFPQDHIDLRNVTAVESAASAESERRFRVHTPYRVFLFEAASAQGKDEWVAILRKAVFRTQNEGESVRISIPLEAIVDIDGSDNSGGGADQQHGSVGVGVGAAGIGGQGQDMITVKVVGASPSSSSRPREGDLDEAEEDQDEDFAIDEYIFLQLAEQSDFVARMRRRLIEYAAELRRGGGDDDAAAAAAAGTSTDPSSTHHPHSAVETLSRPRMRVRDSTNSFSSLGGGGVGGVAVDIPTKAAATAMSRTPRSSLSRDEGPLSSSAATLRTTPLSASQHNYPPSPSSRPRPSVSNSVILAQARAEGRWTVPQWVRDASTKVLATTAGGGADAWSAISGRLPRRPVKETWSSQPGGGGGGGGDDDRRRAASSSSRRSAGGASGSGSGSRSRHVSSSVEELSSGNQSHSQSHSGGETDAMAQSGELSNSSYSMLDNGDVVGDDDDDGHQAELDNDDEAIQAQFRQCFALPAHEALVWHTSASLYRVLPVVGRLFISTNYVCFRSSRLASKTMGRTLMILPIKEIVSAARNTAYRYGHHGLVIMVRGHEELFLEFASPERRGHCLSLLDAQIEAARRARASEVMRSHSQSRREAVMLTDLVDRLDLNPSQEYDQDQEQQQQQQQQQQQHSLSPETMPSAIFKSSTSDALLDFKPAKPLHFTFLTIGSRGDVQPYIALAKGLMDEGHRVRIATHREFGSWIARHGIEFKEVGGDPAELMRICVENGTFTMSFLREGVTKFRGWLDDLLVSCWNACQGTDVIVESPSAIAGIHIAESLEVPYYRSFTMPWSRTRAYPHAFAVPGHKAGGNYNYMSYVIFDQVFWRAAAGQINSWRRKVLQLKPTNLDRMEQHKVPFLYNFSPSLVPKPLDWYDWIHVTGFWFLDNPDVATGKTWTPPADLVAFVESARGKGKKLVYIGWGSIVVSDAEAMTRCVVEAVHRSGVCAILSKGWSDRLSHRSSSSSAEAGDVGASSSSSSAAAAAAMATATPVLSPPIVEEDIFQVNSVPHDWLFPRIDAACHHGGAGTLGASLRAGIPTIVKPYFGDQFFWGQQVEALGVGSFVRELTADSLAKALYKATHDAKTIERARQLGSEIGREDGVANAIKAIYRDMDYARSRIRADGRLDGAAVQQQQEQQERVAKGRLAGLQLPALPALPFLGAGEKTATSSSAGIATATSAPLTQESLRTIQQQEQSSLASGQSLPPDTIVTTTTTTTGDAHAGPSSMPAHHLLSPSLTDAETRSEDDWSVVSGSEPSEDHPRH